MQGCNKKFAQSTNLKSHILTHAKQKSGRGSVSSPDSGHALENGHHGLDTGVSVLHDQVNDNSVEDISFANLCFNFSPSLCKLKSQIQMNNSSCTQNSYWRLGRRSSVRFSQIHSFILYKYDGCTWIVELIFNNNKYSCYNMF